MKNIIPNLTLAGLIISMFKPLTTLGGCEKSVGGKKVVYHGEPIDGFVIERNSIETLNRLYPGLYITEKIFTGNLQTCTTDCQLNFIICGAD